MSTRTHRYPGLNGLRAGGLVVVLGYHGGFAPFRGGAVGLDVFFTLSGFLITWLLLQERDRTGRVDLRSFYRRRALRLLPSLVPVLVVVPLLVLAGAYARPTPRELPTVMAAAALYATNWFESVDAAPFGPLGHLWSLAIEEQYYLLWPLVLVVAVRRRLLVVAGCVAGAALSGLLLAVLWSPSPAPSVYYRTDTRCGPLLLGAALAVVYLARPHVGPRTRAALRVAGAAGALVLVAAVRLLDVGLQQEVAFRGGLQVVWLAALAVVALCVWCPPAWVDRLCRTRPVSTLAAVSYASYLWNPPVNFLLHDEGQALTRVQGAVGVAVTLLLGAASTYGVERAVARRLRARRPAVASRPLASTAA